MLILLPDRSRFPGDISIRQKWYDVDETGKVWLRIETSSVAMVLSVFYHSAIRVDTD